MIAWILVAVAKLLTGAQVVRPLAPGPARQRVFFANHTSHLDFVVLWSALPREVRRLTRPVGGRDYWGTSPIRRYIAEQAFNAILIDRSKERQSPEQAAAGARAQIERIASEMGDSYSIIVFPEGTRGSGEQVGPFKSGLYHLCTAKPGLELVPVYLANMNRILPKGEIVPVPMVGSVIFGDPIRMEEGEAKERFLARAREAVVRLRTR